MNSMKKIRVLALQGTFMKQIASLHKLRVNASDLSLYAHLLNIVSQGG